MTIAHNLLTDHYRRQRLRVTASLDEHPFLADMLASEDDAFERAPDARRAARAGSPASASATATALALRYGADLTAADIGAVLGLSAGHRPPGHLARAGPAAPRGGAARAASHPPRHRPVAIDDAGRAGGVADQNGHALDRGDDHDAAVVAGVDGVRVAERAGRRRRARASTATAASPPASAKPNRQARARGAARRQQPPLEPVDPHRVGLGAARSQDRLDRGVGLV